MSASRALAASFLASPSPQTRSLDERRLQAASSSAEFDSGARHRALAARCERAASLELRTPSRQAELELAEQTLQQLSLSRPTLEKAPRVDDGLQELTAEEEEAVADALARGRPPAEMLAERSFKCASPVMGPAG